MEIPSWRFLDVAVLTVSDRNVKGLGADPSREKQMERISIGNRTGVRVNGLTRSRAYGLTGSLVYGCTALQVCRCMGLRGHGLRACLPLCALCNDSTTTPHVMLAEAKMLSPELLRNVMQTERNCAHN